VALVGKRKFRQHVGVCRARAVVEGRQCERGRVDYSNTCDARHRRWRRLLLCSVHRFSTGMVYVLEYGQVGGMVYW